MKRGTSLRLRIVLASALALYAIGAAAVWIATAPVGSAGAPAHSTVQPRSAGGR